jgi:hypothetical protein
VNRDISSGTLVTSNGFRNEVGHGRELAHENLFVAEAESPDSPRLLKQLAPVLVLLAVVARTVNLNDEFVCRQVEIRNPITGRVEALLKTIGKAERSEVRAEQVLRGRCPPLSLSDEDGVLLRTGKFREMGAVYQCHTTILIRNHRVCREKKNRGF